jgi:hypothetical protein
MWPCRRRERAAGQPHAAESLALQEMDGMQQHSSPFHCCTCMYLMQLLQNIEAQFN